MAIRRTNLTPASIQKRRINRRKWKRLLLISISIFFLIGLILLTHVPILMINRVEVSGNEVVQTADIEKVASAAMSHPLLRVLSRYNFLLVPKKEIQQVLLTDYKRLLYVSVSVPSPHVLAIAVTERKGKYLWCGATLPAPNTIPNCFFVDDNGYIFAQAPFFSGDVYFTLYGGSIDPANPVGQTLLDPELFQNIITLADGLPALNLEAESALINPDLSTYQIYLTKFSNSQAAPAEIIANLSDDPNTLISNIQTAFQTPTFENQFNTSKTNLLYLDLRFEDKVYYKFGSSSAASTSTSSNATTTH